MNSSKSQIAFTLKNLIALEAGGAVFSFLITAFLRRLYVLSGGELIGVLFGAVNDSVWENTKLIMIAYIFWGLIELLCLRVPFKRFVAAKAASLCLLAAVHIIFCLAAFGFAESRETVYLLGSFCILPASALNIFLLKGDFCVDGWFIPGLFVLILFWSTYFCFTPFPPRLGIFMDSVTLRYGLIPKNLDVGAFFLCKISLILKI